MSLGAQFELKLQQAQQPLPLLFRVTCEHSPRRVFVDTSPDAVWLQVANAIHDARFVARCFCAQCDLMIFPNSNASLFERRRGNPDGVERFGLRDHAVRHLLQQLPGAEKCAASPAITNVATGATVGGYRYAALRVQEHCVNVGGVGDPASFNAFPAAGVGASIPSLRALSPLASSSSSPASASAAALTVSSTTVPLSPTALAANTNSAGGARMQLPGFAPPPPTLAHAASAHAVPMDQSA